VAWPFATDTLYRNELNSTLNMSVRSLRTAEQNAVAGLGDSPWGVKFQSGSITLFKGTSFAAIRDTSQDTALSVSSRSVFSGTDEVVFAKLSGTPAATATITISENGLTDNILLNSKGIISY